MIKSTICADETTNYPTGSIESLGNVATASGLLQSGFHLSFAMARQVQPFKFHRLHHTQILINGVQSRKMIAFFSVQETPLPKVDVKKAQERPERQELGKAL